MASGPTKWVILIAIDFYVDPSQRLEGCVNDIDDIDSWLKRNHDRIDVTKFLAANTGDPGQKAPAGPAAAWPTYENIKRKVQEITKRAQPEDFVHIHYSGHGALKPTTVSYKENNGSDAALVLFDVEEEVRYLRGIELALLFDDMVKKQLKLTVILDCCHAGSISRTGPAAYVHIRGVVWNTMKAGACTATAPTGAHSLASFKRTHRDAETNQHWLLRPEGYTLIAGCGLNEIAGECRGEDGRIHGALSYLLLGVLASALGEVKTIAFASIYRQLRAKFHARLPQQNPVLLGNASASFLSDDPVRGSHGSHSAFSVVKASGIDQIWLDIGHAHGVCLEDVFVIHSEDIQANEVMKNQSDMNKVKIVAVHALQSRTELAQSSSKGASIQTGWHATPVLRSRLKTQIVLFDSAGEEWVKEINGSMWLQVVDQWQATLALPTLHVRITESNMLSILDGSGQGIHTFPPTSLCGENAVRQVVLILEHIAKFSSIENLSNRSDTALGDGDFSVELRSEDEGEPSSGGNTPDIMEGARLGVIFKNNTNVPLNLTVLNLRPLQDIKRIYPSRDRGAWKVVQPKGLQYEIDFPGETSFKVTMSFPDKLKAEGRSRIEDILKVFVTTRPSIFDGMELPKLTEQSLKPSRNSISTILPDLLQNLAIGHQPSYILRGESDVSAERWDCRNFIVNTKRRALE